MSPRSIHWLILTTEDDFFTPAGVQPVYEEAARWHGLFGEADKVGLFMGPGKHGTPLESREALYAFLIRWLQPGTGMSSRESDVKLYADSELQVTKAGQVEFEKGSRWLYQVIRERYLARKRPLALGELRAELRRLGIPSRTDSPRVASIDEQRGGTVVQIETEPGVTITGTLHVPESAGRKPALLLVKDATTRALAEKATGRGYIVLELEPRDSPAADDRRPFLGNWMTNLRADSIGLNLAAMRAHDIVRAVDLLRGRTDVNESRIRAAASGVKGVWLLLAAAASRRFEKIWLDRTPYNLASALDGPVHTRLFDAMIPGFLLHWDFPDLVRAAGSRRLLWTDPTDWMGNVAAGRGTSFRYRRGGDSDAALLTEFLEEP